MTTLRRFRPLLMVFAFLALSATSVFASHFRYGTITWSTPNPGTPNVIIARFDGAFRRDFFAGPPIVGNVVDGSFQLQVLNAAGTSQVVSAINMPLTVTSVNTTENWIGVTFQTQITLPFATANYILRFESCCRLSNFTLQNSDTSFRVDSGVTIRVPPLSTNRPPTAASLPIIRVPFGNLASFVLPAFDPDGDTLTYRAQTSAEASSSTPQVVNPVPTGLTIVASGPNAGRVTWSTTQPYVVLNALYMASFRVTDPFGAFVVVDVLLQPVNAVGNPPVVTINNINADASFSVIRGQAMSFVVKGVDPDASTVTMQSSTLPPGAAMTPSLPTSSATGTVQSTFNWTPATNQTGGYVVQYTVFDGNGATSSRQVNITVTNNPPVFTQCFATGTTIEATGFSGGPWGLNMTVTDLDPTDPLTVKVSVDGVLKQTFGAGVSPLTRNYVPTNFALGSHTYIAEVTDGISAPVTCTGSFSIVDHTGPSLTNPPNLLKEATGPGGASATYLTPTATDIADSSVIATCTPPSGSTFPIGVNTVTCTATDDSLNTSSVTFTINVRDMTAPSIAPHGDVPATLNGSHTVDVSYTSPTATDIVDGSFSATCAPASGSTFSIGTTPIACTATDAHGNSASSSFNVVVTDPTAPSVSASVVGAQGLNGWYISDVAVSFTVIDLESDVTATGCDAATVSTDTTGVSFNCSATSAGGSSSASATVKRDVTPPLLAAPASVTAEATSSSGATVLYGPAAASDATSGLNGAASCSPAGGQFPLGATTVLCNASDNAGNSSSASFDVTVVDTTGPAIAPHADVPATLSGSTTVDVTYVSPTSSDLVDGPVDVTCGPVSGSTFSIGTTAITCSATDAHGNSSSSSFNVVVSDPTPPSVTANVSGAQGSNGWYILDASVSFTVVDNESAVTSTGCDAVTVSTDTTGVTFTCSATSAGGTSSASATVTRDATAPSLTVSPSLSAEAADSSGASVSYAAASVTDATSGVNGAASCFPASGSVFAIGATVVNCSASDNAGNEAIASFTVTVGDSTGPSIAPHADVPATLSGATTIVVTFTNPTATDAVDGPLSTTCSPASGSAFGLGTTPVSCSVTDAHGNSSSSSFNVIVSDATAPSITPSVGGTLGTNGWYRSNIPVSFTVVDNESAVTSSGCDAVTVSSDTAGVTFTCTASSAGGSNSASVTVKRDATSPVVSTSSPISVVATNAAGTLVTFADATAADNLSGVASIASCSPPSGYVFPIGVNTVTCSATDNAGNAGSATFTVSVTDTIPPVVSSATPSIGSLWPPNHAMIPLTIAVSATDNVGIAQCVVSSATSNEPDNGQGDGDTSGDIVVGPGLNVQLRAERSGKGDGRIYTVTVRCTDAAGNATTRATQVVVPKNQSQ